MAKNWDKENMKTISTNVKKDEAEAFRRAAEEKGTTPGALLRGFVRESIRDEREREPNVGKMPLMVSYRNVDRIKAETAHHNPGKVLPADMLDYILDRYFRMAEMFRK